MSEEVVLETFILEALVSIPGQDTNYSEGFCGFPHLLLVGAGKVTEATKNQAIVSVTLFSVTNIHWFPRRYVVIGSSTGDMNQGRFSHRRNINMKSVIPDNCLDLEKKMYTCFWMIYKKKIWNDWQMTIWGGVRICALGLTL